MEHFRMTNKREKITEGLFFHLIFSMDKGRSGKNFTEDEYLMVKDKTVESWFKGVDSYNKQRIEYENKRMDLGHYGEAFNRAILSEDFKWNSIYKRK